MADDSTEATISALLDAALPNVAFDGWSDLTLQTAIRDSGVPDGLARALLPRGPVDLALAYHRRGDETMLSRLAETDMSELRYRDKVALAVRLRIEATPDREAVRRGVTLFALPQYAGLGTRALWGTSDAIWSGLGDTSVDLNWYSKRATLSAVYASTVLYWIGDESPNAQSTWEFLDRRIEDVMQIEKAKARIRKTPGLGAAMSVPNWFIERMRGRTGNGVQG